MCCMLYGHPPPPTPHPSYWSAVHAADDAGDGMSYLPTTDELVPGIWTVLGRRSV
jgi:hypothetical protein